jgi:cysteine desulfurase / selenocysteine lyase
MEPAVMDDHATLDLARLRRDTPGVQNRIHLNNAGMSLPPVPVLATVIAHLRREAEIGGYEAAAEVQARVDAVYVSVARLLGAAPEEIALVENATVGWLMAFHAIPFQPGDRILTAEAEYASNYISYLQAARRYGLSVEPVPSLATGELDVEALERMIDGRVRLISITHVPTNGGLINPAAEVGAVARRHGILYLLDACQSAGQLPLDVGKLGCDMLTATGRKYLRGPRGTGFLYVRRSVVERLEPPMLDLRAATWVAPDRYECRPDAKRFENWEKSWGAFLGLGAAVDYALDLGLDRIAGRIGMLAERLRAGLARLSGVTVHDIGRRRCGIVSFSAAGRPAEEIRAALAARGVNVSVSSPSSTLLDALARRLPDVVRASVHYYNDESEIERFLALLPECLA